MEREGWIIEDPRWYQPIPAAQNDIDETENRLNVVIPTQIKSFYLASNGWPAGPHLNAPINRIQQWGCLESASVSVHQCAANAVEATWPNRDEDAPELAAFRNDQGTRVLRSVAVTYDIDDREVVLLDPLADWQCGDWQSDNPAMIWNGSFGDFMVKRLQQWEEF